MTIRKIVAFLLGPQLPPLHPLRNLISGLANSNRSIQIPSAEASCNIALKVYTG